MRFLRPAIGLLVSLVLVWLLLRTTDLGGLGETLLSANYASLVPAILVYFAGVWVRSLRWGILLKPVASLPTSKLFRATLIGFTVNDLMPIRLGEIARAILLIRWANVPPGATLGTIVVERLFDGLTLCAIVGLAWLWLPLDGWLRAAALLGGAVFTVGTLGAILAAFQPELMLRLVRFFTSPAPGRLKERLLGIFENFLAGLSILRRGRLLLLMVVLSAIAWLTEATMYYLIMLGFGFDAGPLASMLGMAAANLGTMVPSSPGFIGTFDVPLQGVLTELFGIDSNLATSYTLVVHAALIIPVVLVGAVLLWREGLSLRDVSSRPANLRRALKGSAGPACSGL